MDELSSFRYTVRIRVVYSPPGLSHRSVPGAVWRQRRTTGVQRSPGHRVAGLRAEPAQRLRHTQTVTSDRTRAVRGSGATSDAGLVIGPQLWTRDVPRRCVLRRSPTGCCEPSTHLFVERPSFVVPATTFAYLIKRRFDSLSYPESTTRLFKMTSSCPSPVE